MDSINYFLGLWVLKTPRSRLEFFGTPSAQSVLLAAGLDVRGYRLDRPSGAVV